MSLADSLFLSLKNHDIFSKTVPAKLQTYMALGKPIIGVNHLVGHALSPRLSEFSRGNPALEFPYLVLLASGGHCQFLEVISPSKF